MNPGFTESRGWQWSNAYRIRDVPRRARRRRRRPYIYTYIFMHILVYSVQRATVDGLIRGAGGVALPWGPRRSIAGSTLNPAGGLWVYTYILIQYILVYAFIYSDIASKKPLPVGSEAPAAALYIYWYMYSFTRVYALPSPHAYKYIYWYIINMLVYTVQRDAVGELGGAGGVALPRRARRS